MSLLTGYFHADRATRNSSCYREFGAGEVVFEEGAPASGLFVVVSGRVEIVKGGGPGEVRLNELGPDAVFGEIGLISEDGVRTATARTLEPTELLEVRNNPLQMFKEMGEIGGATVLLTKLICVLGEWLRAKNESAVVGAGGSGGWALVVEEGPDPEAEAAAEVVKRHLPKRLFHRSFKTIRLPKGEWLCRQGDAPDGFYFIHEGSLDVLNAATADAEGRKIGLMRGPTVAGELGFFSGKPRSVGLRASTDVVYSHFSGADFEKLEEKRSDEALEVLFAAAQLIVHLICEREEPA